MDIYDRAHPFTREEERLKEKGKGKKDD